jgi:hypothetical protein
MATTSRIPVVPPSRIMQPRVKSLAPTASPEDIATAAKAVYDQLKEDMEGEMEALKLEFASMAAKLVEKEMASLRKEFAKTLDEVTGRDERALQDLSASIDGRILAFVKDLPATQVNLPTDAIKVIIPDQKAPIVNVAAAESPSIVVNVPQGRAPEVTVNVPKQEAPVVNNTVNVPEMKVPEIRVEAPVTVNVPEQRQEAPVVNVSVPEMKPPEIKVEVTTPKRIKDISYDEYGRPTRISEREEV